MSERLAMKVAIVTGGASGLGLATAARFVEEGASVIVTDKDEDRLNGAFGNISNIEPLDRRYQDVTDEIGWESLINYVLNEYGRLDILVNNAGITKDNLLMRMSEDDFDHVLEVNLKSVFNMTHAIQRAFLKQRHGSLIHLSSVVGVKGNAGQSNYAASKAGIIGFSKSVALELGSRNIRSNVIAPGFIETEMTARLSEEVVQGWRSGIPLKRGGTPKDVAEACVFLASDLSSYITGQVLHVDGGMLT